MKISVVTVVYNDFSGIEKTINSILNQSYENFEYIVIDKLSTDGTKEIIDTYASRIDTLISENDNGLYNAMNKSISLATGDYIIFIHSGDIFYNDSVLEYFASRCDGSDVCYGDAVLVRKIGKKFVLKGDIADIFVRMPFDHQACFMKKELLMNLKFNESFNITADYDLILRAFKKKCSFSKIPDFIVAVRVLDGLSASNGLRTSVEAYHALLNYDADLNYPDMSIHPRSIVDRLLGFRYYDQLKQFLVDLDAFRSVSFLNNPISKLKYFSIFLRSFYKLYIS